MMGGFSEDKIVETKSDLSTFEPDNKVLLRIAHSFQNGSIKKTQIQLDSKLRWDLFSKYWDWLKGQEFIRSIDENKRKNEYMLTPRGNELFNLFQKYYELLHVNNELPQILT